jgi:hypothetical protein
VGGEVGGRVKVTSKAQMQRMLQAGDFGNTQRMWSTNDFFLLNDSDYDATFALRSFTPGKTFWPWLNADECLDKICALTLQGGSRDYYVQEVACPSHIVLAGEIGTVGGVLVLEYSRVQEMMRDALQKERIHVKECAARCMLRVLLDIDDYEDLMLLCDTYPEHVIEFTLFDCCIGIRQRRLMIWEVRHY